MDPSHISALLEPFLESPLTSTQLNQISTYIDLLLRWNARINLTAIRNPEQIVERHFGESLFLARHLFPKANIDDCSKLRAQRSELVRVLDIGSGAGFPALPIRIWAPEIHLTMIESNHKKAAFLREAVRALTLTNVNVIAQRAESIAPEKASAALTIPGSLPGSGTLPANASEVPQTADIVTFRAVEKFSQVLPQALRFLTPTGALALLITEPQLKELQTLPFRAWSKYTVPQSHQRVAAIGTK